MAQLSDDKLKWTLDINGDPARKAINDLNDSTQQLKKTNRDLNLELQKLESQGKKNTDEYRLLEKQMRSNQDTIKANEKQMGALRKELGINKLTAAELRKEIGQLKTTMSKLDPNTKEWRRYNAELLTAQKRLDQVRGGTNRVNEVFGFFKKLGIAALITQLASKFTSLVSKVVEVRASFQKFAAVLANSLNSKADAMKAMAMIQEFAAKTPFQVDELTSSYVKLVNQGFKPTRNQMTSLGDLASSTGKKFDQLTEAIIDAQTFEFERLKEFGIRAKQNKNDIEFTFKGVKTTVDKSSEAVRNYILSLGQLQGVEGSMAAISKTWEGRLSNIEDSFTNLYNLIGVRFNKAITSTLEMFGNLVQKVTDWVSIPVADTLRQQRTEFNELMGALMVTNEGTKERIRIIKELQEKYPDLIGNIDLEKASYGELQKILQDTNVEFEKKIRLAVLEDKLTENRKKAVELDDKKYELTKKMGNFERAFFGERFKMLTKEQRKKEMDLFLEQRFQESIKKRKQLDPLNQAQGASWLLEDVDPLKEKVATYQILVAQIENIDKGFNELQREYSSLMYDKFKVEPQKLDESANNNSVKNSSKSSQTNDNQSPLAREASATFETIKSIMDAEVIVMQKGEEAKVKSVKDAELVIRQERETTAEITKLTIEQQFEVYAGFFSELSNLFGKSKKGQKAAVLAQLAADTASAIGSLTRNSEGNPLNLLTGGTAGIIQFATGMLRIVGNIAMARKKLKEMDSYAIGGFTPQGGKYQPAGIVHAGEFVANQDAVNNPNIRPVLDAIDLAQRTNSIRNLNLAGAMQSGLKGYATGGYVTNNNTTNNYADAETKALMAATYNLLADIKNEGVKGVWEYDRFKKGVDDHERVVGKTSL